MLLSESASLSARETLTVLGSRGVRADVLTAGGLPIGRFAAFRLLASPRSAAALASGAVQSCRISPGAIALARTAHRDAG